MFFALTSKIPLLDTVLKFDADVKKTTTRHSKVTPLVHFVRRVVELAGGSGSLNLLQEQPVVAAYFRF